MVLSVVAAGGAYFSGLPLWRGIADEAVASEPADPRARVPGLLVQLSWDLTRRSMRRHAGDASLTAFWMSAGISLLGSSGTVRDE